MIEIKKVHLEPARNAAHYELVHQILEFAKKCAVVLQNMAAQFHAYEAAVNEEGRILGISLKSDATELLAKNDRERDWLVTGSKAIYTALTEDADPAVAEAARMVLNQFESLGVDTQSNYLQETGEIDVLLSALFGAYASQVETCKLENLRQYLKESNDRMHQLLNERDLVQAPRVGTAMADARTATDTAFRAFVKFYNAWILVNDTTLTQEQVAACNLFATETNTKIEYFKRYVLKEPGSSGTGTGTETNPGEQQPGSGEGQQPGTGEQPGTNPGGSTGTNPGANPGEDEQPGQGENNGGNTGGGSNTGNENNGNQQEEDDPNMPPPGSGGSGFE